jgi:hypothetical protein
MQTRHKILTFSNTTAIALTFEDNIQSSYTLVVQNNNDSGYIYLGSSEVSSSSYGYKLYPGQGFTIEMSSLNRLYASPSSSGLTVSILVIERAI